MSGPKRDASVFAERVRMSRGDVLFVLVEGKEHDRPFYDRLVQQRLGLREGEFFVQLVEDLELAGKSGGGKDFAHALFDYFDANGLLIFRNRSGRPRIVFMLDRDVDDFSGKNRRSAHVVYTFSSDVESEILINADLVEAVSVSYGITRAECHTILGTRFPASVLASLWKDWVILGVFAALIHYRGGSSTRQPSLINDPQYASTSSTREQEWRDRIESGRGSGCTASYAQAARVTESVYIAGEQDRLIKGRWIAGYIDHLANQFAASLTMKMVPASVVTKVAIGTIDFSAQWSDYYFRHLTQVMAA